MQINNEQIELVKKSLNAAVRHKGNLYAKKYADIDIDTITAESFSSLPFMEKSELREGYPLGVQAVGDEKIVRIHSSSGTTGTPIIIPYTQKDVDDWAIMFARCYEMAGVTKTDRVHITPPDTDCGRQESVFSSAVKDSAQWQYLWGRAIRTSSSK